MSWFLLLFPGYCIISFALLKNFVQSLTFSRVLFPNILSISWSALALTGPKLGKELYGVPKKHEEVIEGYVVIEAENFHCTFLSLQFLPDVPVLP